MKCCNCHKSFENLYHFSFNTRDGYGIEYFCLKCLQKIFGVPEKLEMIRPIPLENESKMKMFLIVSAGSGGDYNWYKLMHVEDFKFYYNIELFEKYYV